MIEQDNVQVSKDQLGKILHLLEKEKLIEKEEQKEKELETANIKSQQEKTNSTKPSV